jgi:WD40 repeat protein
MLFVLFEIYRPKRKIKKKVFSRINLSFKNMAKNIRVRIIFKYQMIRFNEFSHITTVNSLRYVEQEKKLVSCSKDGLIRLWQITNQRGLKLLQSFFIPLDKRNNYISSIDISPDNRIMAIGGKLNPLYIKKNLTLYHLDKGGLTNIDETVPVSALAFSKNRNILAYGMVNGEVNLLYNFHWKKDKRKLKFKYDKLILEEHPSFISKIGFSKDRIAVASADGMIKIYDLSEKVKFLKSIESGEESILDLSYTTDGLYLVVLSGKRVLIFDKKGKLVGETNYFDYVPKVLSVVSDKDKIIVGFENGKVKKYDLPNGRESEEIKIFDDSISAMVSAFIGDRHYIVFAGGSKHEIMLSDEFGKVYMKVSSPGSEIKRIAYSEDKIIGFSLKKGGKGYENSEADNFEKNFDINLIKIKSGFEDIKYSKYKLKYDEFSLEHKPYFMEDMGVDMGFDTIEIQKNGEPFARILRSKFDGGKHLSFSFINDYYIVSGGENGTICIYSINGEKVAELIGHRDDITDLAPSENARILVASSKDKTFSFWFFGDRYLDEGGKRKKAKLDWKRLSFFYSEAKIDFLKKKLKNFKTSDIITYKALKNYLINLSYHSYEYLPVSKYFKHAKAIIYPYGQEEPIVWDMAGFFCLNKFSMWDKVGFEVYKGYNNKVKFEYLSQIYKRYYYPSVYYIHDFHGEPLFTINDLLLFPQIDLLSPKNGEEIPDREVEMKFRVENPFFLGIKGKRKRISNLNVRIYNNGKLVKYGSFGDKIDNFFTGSNDDNRKSILTTNKYSVYNFTIPLVQGINKISYEFYKKDSSFYSKRKSVVVKSNAIFEKPKLYFIIIGNDKFERKKHNLKYAMMDMEALSYQIQENYGDYYDKVIVKKYPNLTKKKMFEVLEKFPEIIKPSDTFVFYFISNSEVRYRYKRKFVTKEKEGYYGLWGDNTFTLSEFAEKVKDIKALNQIFIFDTECYSERYCEINKPMITKKWLANFAYDMGVSIILSSVSKKLTGAFDKYNIITYCFLKALKGEADYNNDRRITIKEIAKYIKKTLKYLAPKNFLPIMVNCDKDIPLGDFSNNLLEKRESK